MAFIFPGQGSQSIGMLSELAERYPLIQETFLQASSVLGYDLWTLCSQGPAERLNSTAVTQVAMLTADIAVWRLWCELSDVRPGVMAGHSLGEYAALVAADAIDFNDAIKLVSARGQLMQDATPDGGGAMAAVIGCSADDVVQLCAQAAQGQVLSPANYNSEGQIVIAGHVDAVDRAVAQAKSAGARLAVKLPMSVPAHCELMSPAEAPYRELLSRVSMRTPSVEVLHNVGVLSYADADDMKQALLAQLTSPVPWVKTIEAISLMSSHYVECGPGKVLMGLNKRIVPDCTTYQINTPESVEHTLSLIQEVV